MNKVFASIAAAALLLTPTWGGALSAAAPPSGGTISIELKGADGEAAASSPSFVNAVGDALAQRGFTILPDPGHAAYVGELILSRVDVGTGSAKVRTGPADASPGGALGSVGAGVSIPLSTGKSTLVPLQRTQLELRIRKRGEDGVVWHGAAMTVRAAGTRTGVDEVVASDLCAAILRGYPADFEGVVAVP
ncbi:hypothetical protein [Sphingomonas nostoxanthinifaciens]|uniref:hypothetical protein n=1 Tax=Sphingomonas nostoxanthinifaciens TaxID=2872652 RepID=UPI001CC1C454|nr:hypothetical protein [Sphingomonas nostoxanthinifaciens]UAK24270.1 hypothetical protein K8P63_18415 [Sphingomonas nostoxanthinifaciens]